MHCELRQSTEVVSIQNEDTSISNKNHLIISETGHGKTVLLERLIYAYYQKGYNVICLTDAKGLVELGFMGFPEDQISMQHSLHLEKYAQEYKPIPIRILHPFTFDVPKTKHFPMTLLTLPLTEICDPEVAFLLEDYDGKAKDSREFILGVLKRINQETTLWDFMKMMEKSFSDYEKEVIAPNPELFGLKTERETKLRSFGGLVSTFKRFGDHFLLQPGKYFMNFDPHNHLFDDKRIVKIFTTRYLNDKKLSDFFTFMVLNMIVKFCKECTVPTLIVIDEVKELLPSRDSRGFKQIMALDMQKHLDTNFRNSNISSICASQSLSAINKNVIRSSSFNCLWLGKITSPYDLDMLGSIYGFKKDTIADIEELERGKFFTLGVLGGDIRRGIPIRTIMAPFGHKQESDNFDKDFLYNYPEQMVSHREIIKKMEAYKQSLIDDDMKLKREFLNEREEEEKKAMEELKAKDTPESSLRRLAREKVGKKKENQIREDDVWERSQKGESQSEIGKKWGISQVMVYKIIKKKRAKIAAEQEAQKEEAEEDGVSLQGEDVQE